MKKSIFLFFTLFLSYQMGFAQENAQFSVKVSMDSILYGNYFQVVFTLKNAKGEGFQAPAFEDFHVKSGPNMSSSFSMINGEVTQSAAYTYYLEPKDVGNYYIQPASIAVGEMLLETDPLEILVVPNPEGLKQAPPREEGMSNFFRGFGEDRMPNLQDFQFDFGDPNSISPGQELLDPSQKPKQEKPKKKKKKRKIYKI
jgi:hypothetical protein